MRERRQDRFVQRRVADLREEEREATPMGGRGVWQTFIKTSPVSERRRKRPRSKREERREGRREQRGREEKRGTKEGTSTVSALSFAWATRRTRMEREGSFSASLSLLLREAFSSLRREHCLPLLSHSSLSSLSSHPTLLDLAEFFLGT